MSLPFERGDQSGLLGPRRDRRGPAALSPARRRRSARARLRQRARFPPQRRALRGVLRRRLRRKDIAASRSRSAIPTLDWDLNRLELLREAVGGARAGHGRCQRGLVAARGRAPPRCLSPRRLRHPLGRGSLPARRFRRPARDPAGARPGRIVNSGEYLDLRGKRKLIEARGVDILNVHGHVTDVMRAGWLAAEHGIPVSLGNTMLELGVHMAAALPHAEWLEYSFQNYNHLVERADRDARRLCHRPGSAGPRPHASARQRAAIMPARRSSASRICRRRRNQARSGSQPNSSDATQSSRNNGRRHAMRMTRRQLMQAPPRRRSPACRRVPRLRAAGRHQLLAPFHLDHRVQGARARDGAVQAEISRHRGDAGEHPEPGIHVEDDRRGRRERQARHLHGRRGTRERLVAMGALTDLTDKIKGWARYGEYPAQAWQGSTVNGKTYGIPAFTFVDWMYYRKDWFAEKGIAPPKTYRRVPRGRDQGQRSGQEPLRAEPARRRRRPEVRDRPDRSLGLADRRRRQDGDRQEEGDRGRDVLWPSS